MAAEVESGRMVSVAKIKEWLTLASLVVVVLGGMLGGMKLAVAPLHKEIQAINGRLDRMDARMDRMEGSITGLYGEMADIRERLRRLETLIEGGSPQPGALAPSP